MPRMVASAPNRIVISNMITTYGGIEPTGLPPRTIGQSYDMYRVIQAPLVQPPMPPITVHLRPRLPRRESAPPIQRSRRSVCTVRWTRCRYRAAADAAVLAPNGAAPGAH